MKNDWLFPHHYRRTGWLLSVPSACLGLIDMYGQSDLLWLQTHLPWLYNSPRPFLLDGDLVGEVAALGRRFRWSLRRLVQDEEQLA